MPFGVLIPVQSSLMPFGVPLLIDDVMRHFTKTINILPAQYISEEHVFGVK